MDNIKGAIGIFGGSFSPPHTGHVLAAHYALLRWNLAKVLIIPSFQHPFGKTLPPFEHRLAMCDLAFAHLRDHVEISDIERQMGGVSYTIETVRELQIREPEQHFHLLIGGDILSEVTKWRQFDELTQIAPVKVIPRISDGQVHGGDHTEAALPEVDSTRIRRTIAEGETPHGALPAQVLDYIRQYKLYILPDEATG